MAITAKLFSIQSDADFEATCMEVFRYQWQHCEVYRAFAERLGVRVDSVANVSQIPFLPIRLFKAKKVYAASKPEEVVFTSSSTTGLGVSKHSLADLQLYRQSFRLGFERFYGKPAECTILALLPSYLERDGSSLIYMVDNLMRLSGKPDSGFFIHNHSTLYSTLCRLQENHERVILIGVSFALLDFVEHYPMRFPELIVMETGGMKGRRKELVREELHAALCNGFGVSAIHSEYGMTECLSQAYSAGKGIYHCPAWMKVSIRDVYDPLTPIGFNSTGGINIIDLANLYSCSFIETQDLGKLHANGSFEVLGRFDGSDIRGCNLMV